jgi:predicted PilT family ATPase
MGEVIGRGGGRVKTLEHDIGMPVDIEEMNFKSPESLTADVTANKINLNVGQEFKDKEVEVLVEDSPLFIARVSKNGIIQVKTKSVQGRALRKAISQGQKIRFSII